MHLTLNGTYNRWGGNPGSIHQWGNTEISDTENLHKDSNGADVYFYYQQRLVNDYVSTQAFNMHAFCQANPFDLAW